MLKFKNLPFAIISLAVCFTSIFAQKIPSFVYDESNGQITAFYNQDSFKLRKCAEIKPLTGLVAEIESNEKEKYLSVTLKSKAEINYIDFIEIGKFPDHIQQNLKNNLLKIGSRIKVWGVRCEDFILAEHIAKATNATNSDVPPESKETILEDKPSDAFKKLEAVNEEITAKVNKIREEFDKEIAPTISNREKGEFETTSEARARLSKLENLRTANRSKLWKRIYLETNSLVKEYLKIVGSYYATPINANLGLYDADIEQFPVIVSGQIASLVEVPRKIAPLLKQNFDKAKVFADYSIEFVQGRLTITQPRVRIEFDGQRFSGTGGTRILSYKTSN